MSLKKFINGIGPFFAHVFDGVEKAWNHLKPQVKEASKYGSGVVDFLNNNTEGPASIVIDLILKAFPQWDKEHLLAALREAAVDLHIAEDISSASLEDAIKIIQAFLASKEGSGWAKASKFLADGIALFTAPAGTKFDVISSILTFVYQTFFKKKG